MAALGETGGDRVNRVADDAVLTFRPIEAVLDIELTTICNASCTFCPRDQTPHLGLMDERTFGQALARAVEYRDAVRGLSSASVPFLETTNDTIWLSFCGMGDALMHPQVIDRVRQVSDAGLRPLLNTNAAKLTPHRADALLDAGVEWVCINAGERDEAYEAVYGLPFQRTHDNVVAFAEKAAGRCVVAMVLVDHRGDPAHRDDMKQYWKARGINGMFPMSLVNRAGALDVPDHDAAHREFGDEARAMFEELGVVPRCGIPFLYPFVGYDGQYYLCSSDWRKDVAVGNVFDHAVVDLYAAKHHHVHTRSPICASCSHEPTNALARALAARAVADRSGGDVDAADANIAAVLAQCLSGPPVVSAVTRGLASPIPVDITPTHRAVSVGS